MTACCPAFTSLPLSHRGTNLSDGRFYPTMSAWPWYTFRRCCHFESISQQHMASRMFSAGFHLPPSVEAPLRKNDTHALTTRNALPMLVMLMTIIIAAADHCQNRDNSRLVTCLNTSEATSVFLKAIFIRRNLRPLVFGCCWGGQRWWTQLLMTADACCVFKILLNCDDKASAERTCSTGWF